jgi:hypothetical protein
MDAKKITASQKDGTGTKYRYVINQYLNYGNRAKKTGKKNNCHNCFAYFRVVAI